MWFQQGEEPVTDAGALARFDAFLDGLGSRTGFVSAEVMWTFQPRDVKVIADHLKAHGIDSRVLCFIRPPSAYLATAAQQRLRSSLAIADMGLDFQDKVLIRYRRLTAWLEEFGAQNMCVLPLAGDIVALVKDRLMQWGIALDAEVPVSRDNQSISLIAAKALLALNTAMGEEKASRRLRTILQDIKGPAFRLPESALKRTAGLARREARYLADTFAMDEAWLLGDVEGIDDRLFFHWTYDEVALLLKAVNAILVKTKDD
jgi:hypothetical protein